MIKRPFKKKQSTSVRHPHPAGQKPSSYHYSSRRSHADKAMDRDVSFDSRNSKKPQAKKFSTILPVVAGTCIIAISLIYMTSLSTRPNLEITGNQTLLLEQNQYNNEIEKILSDSPLNKSKLTVDKLKIAELIAMKFPEFSSVNITTPLIRHQPVVQVVVAQPSSILETGGGRFLLDQNGRVLFDINKSNKKVETEKLPVVRDNTNTPVKIGKPALTTSQISFIHEVAMQSANRSLGISSMDLTAGGGELDVRYVGVPYFVKFNFFEDARKSSGTFFAIKERLDLENKPPAEYIDVRVPERAYVK